MPQEEILESESKQETGNDSIAYIEAIKGMKQNSVSREAYDKLKKENQELLNALVDGRQIDIEEKKPVDIDQLRKKLFNSDKQLTNLEYIESALELRDALIAKGERDPFLPYGEIVNVTADQIEKAELVATIFKECVEFADGDSGIFTAELQRRTKEAPRYGKK